MIRTPAVSALLERSAGSAVTVPSKSPSCRGSAAFRKSKRKNTTWDRSDRSIFDSKGKVKEYYPITEDFFTGWIVTCNAGPSSPPGSSFPRNTENLVPVKFMVKPPIQYLPPGSLALPEDQNDRIRFTVPLERNTLTQLRNGDEVTQKEVAEVMLAKQKKSRLRLDPRIPRKEVFEWMCKAVDWRMVPEQGKCCGVR
jgi:hypothetical protein